MIARARPVPWIFGYGSLVWRPAFAHAERAPGYIEGYVRRFWQASPDHRGTPEAPGRVVTLHAAPGVRLWGMGYRIEPAVADEILAALDHRERAGYQRVETPLVLRDGRVVDALVYIAGPDNPNYVGPAPIDDIARVVRSARGPSGANIEYVVELARALEAIGERDEHLSDLLARVDATLARVQRR